jgi:hypothetical protein
MVNFNYTEQDVSTMLGIATPWPTTDIILKLVEATDILLHHHNYDGHGYELLQGAMNEGIRRVETITSTRKEAYERHLLE